MSKKLLTLLAPLAALGFGISTAHANFISSNFVDNGDYTTDLVSGLDWLDMSFTVGNSYNTVQSMISSGGSLDGWTVATADQLDALFNNASDIDPLPTSTSSLGTHVYAVSDYFSEAAGLIDLLGSTYVTMDFETSVTEGIVGFLAHAYELNSSYQYYGSIVAVNYYSYTDVGHLRTRVDGGIADRTSSDPSKGTFLVRESVSVPEPSSLLLMGIGLAGLGFVRLRKRS